MKRQRHNPQCRRLLALLLCAAMLIVSVPTALAADDPVRVWFLFANGSEMQTAFALDVTDGTAERYGYDVAEKDHAGQPIGSVTVMDVLVAAHAAIYGDAFTPQTAETYLEIERSFLLKVFGHETSNLGFTINGVMPHDGVMTDSGYYTGYAVDTARVRQYDHVTLFLYQDQKWMDMQTQIDCPDIVTAGESFTVTAHGYSVMPYGCCTQETIDENTKPLVGATLEWTKDFKTFTPLGTFGADGTLSVTLPEDSVYYFVVRGSYTDGASTVPLIGNYVTVSSMSSDPHFPTGILPMNPVYVPIFFTFDVIRQNDHRFWFCIEIYMLDLVGNSRPVIKELPLFPIPFSQFLPELNPVL